MFLNLMKISEDDLIKRVIGLPGETIEVKNRQVYIDRGTNRRAIFK